MHWLTLHCVIPIVGQICIIISFLYIPTLQTVDCSQGPAV